MAQVGDQAPNFTLTDQFSRSISLEQFRGKKHVMLLFYPLDFTPT
jgi:peroxiredoxin